jgi:hypothetical protein
MHLQKLKNARQLQYKSSKVYREHSEKNVDV